MQRIVLLVDDRIAPQIVRSIDIHLGDLNRQTGGCQQIEISLHQGGTFPHGGKGVGLHPDDIDEKFGLKQLDYGDILLCFSRVSYDVEVINHQLRPWKILARQTKGFYDPLPTG